MSFSRWGPPSNVWFIRCLSLEDVCREAAGGWRRSAWTTRGLNLLLMADTTTYLETELCQSFTADLAMLLEGSFWQMWCLKKEKKKDFDSFFMKNWYATRTSKALIPTINVLINKYFHVYSLIWWNWIEHILAFSPLSWLYQVCMQ